MKLIYFPLILGHAKATLLLHKPWSQNNPLMFDTDSMSIEKEFNSFLADERCPFEVKLHYAYAVE